MTDYQKIVRFVLVAWLTLFLVNTAGLLVVSWSVKTGRWKKEEPQSQNLVLLPSALPSTPAFPSIPPSPSPLPSLAPSPKTVTYINVPETQPKEYYIPLGSFSGKSFGAWADTGMQAYIDPANYPGANFYLEASGKIPTANGQVKLRLNQANENAFIYSSEIIFEGNQAKIISSNPLTLWTGNKLYKVEIYSSMDFDAIIDFARIKVVI